MFQSTRQEKRFLRNSTRFNQMLNAISGAVPSSSVDSEINADVQTAIEDLRRDFNAMTPDARSAFLDNLSHQGQLNEPSRVGLYARFGLPSLILGGLIAGSISSCHYMDKIENVRDPNLKTYTFHLDQTQAPRQESQQEDAPVPPGQ